MKHKGSQNNELKLISYYVTKRLQIKVVESIILQIQGKVPYDTIDPQ
jgi:hypothetical protein